VPCHRKDLATLPFCVDALRSHPQVASVSVIADRSLQPECERLEVGFVDELSLLEPWFASDEPTGNPRWYYQMFLKLSLAFAEEGALASGQPPLDRYLIVDADTVLLNPFALIDEQLGTVLAPRMSEHFQSYFSGIRELLGEDVAYEGSHNAHFMVFRVPLIRAMFDEFARVAGRGTDDGRDVLRAFLQRCDRHSLSFADYETYGYFVRRHFPDELAWAERRQLNVLYVSPNAHAITRLRPYYHYCSFHAYRRPGRLSLRAAGSAWLELRLARDRLGDHRVCA